MTKKILFIFVMIFMVGCASESHRQVSSESVRSYGTNYSGPKQNIIVGKFANSSNYGAGIFSDGIDRLAGQARTILKTHLQQTNRFIVLDRENLQQNAQEAKFAGVKQNIIGAKYTISGNVTEFGRKVVGDKQLFGVLGKGKQQIAYAKVMLNVIDVKTSGVVHSVHSAGEYKLSNREVIGFGGTAGYDSTLNGKVLDMAIRESVNKLVEDLESNKLNL